MAGHDLFQVVAAPTLAPGTCFRCRSNRQGPFVDTSVTDPFLGTFYLCKGCIVMMYNALIEAGAIEVTPVEVETLLDEARNQGFIEGVKALKDSVDDTAALYVDRSLNTVLATPSVSPVNEPSPVPGDSVGEEGSGTSADSDSKQVNGSTGKQGRASVPSNSGDGPKFDSSDI